MKLVYVRWIDSAAPSDSSWHKVEDLSLEPLACDTVGYLVSETKTGVSIASSVMENGLLYGVITIPKVAVLKRRTLAR